MSEKRECTIVLQGETPSKKNSRINTRSGRSFPNKRYVEWHKNAVMQIQRLIDIGEIKRIPEGKSVILSATFYHGDFKRRDSDNQLSSILDTLVDSKVLIDDNWRIIPEKHIFDKYEKNNAHCVIQIFFDIDI